MFSFEFCKTSKNTFVTEHLRATVSARHTMKFYGVYIFQNVLKNFLKASIFYIIFCQAYWHLKINLPSTNFPGQKNQMKIFLVYYSLNSIQWCFNDEKTTTIDFSESSKSFSKPAIHIYT